MRRCNMNIAKRNKIKNIQINIDDTLLHAIKKMDREIVKLLIVNKNDNFYSLISIGDIQRAIISNHQLTEYISTVLRDDITVASEKDTIDEIKKKMLIHRAEFMPILDNKKRLIDVYFWNELFDSDIKDEKRLILDIPVVIMAGGKGTRLKPITNIIPKALIPLGEKTIIEIIIDNFNKIGVKEYFISLNYKSEMIEAYFNQVEHKNYRLNYFHESMPLGTAGSLSLLKDKIHKTFFISNCDILIDEDYIEIYNYHKEISNDLTIVGSLKHYDLPYGILETEENGKLKRLKEKPELTFLVNTGMYILEPEILKMIPDNTHYHITDLIEKINEKGGKVGVFPISEKSLTDIGTWVEYQKMMQANY